MPEDMTTDTTSKASVGTSAAPSHTNPPGYELLDEVGRGGMGVVFRARDITLDRDVAVKFLADSYPPDSAAAQRFLTEARITAQLQHPGIPAVHQVGSLADGRPFLAMKLIKGRTLEATLKERPDAVADRGQLVAVFEAIGQAVAYAHAHRVIHRDIKPANIMVGAFGEVQVMDWGLAKVLGEQMPVVSDTMPPVETRAWTEVSPMPESGLHTQAGSLLGTPAFVSPEQAAGELGKVDERSDVFGLGALLAVILTGKPPYVGESFESVRVLAVRGKLDDCFARLAACEAEPGLVALCKQCLAFEPADRPRDAGEVARAVAGLRSAADERARQAEVDRERAAVRAGEERKRRRLFTTAVAAIAVVLAIGAGISVWQMTRANNEATNARDAEAKAREAEATARDSESTALEREKAEKTARETAEAISTFMQEVFIQGSAYGQASATRGVNRDLTVKEAMKYAADKIEGRFKSRPDLEAGVRSAIGETYYGLGAFTEAAQQYERAIALIENAVGPEHAKIHGFVCSLAVMHQNKGDKPTAERLFKQGLAGSEKELGPDHAETLLIANNFAVFLQEKGDYEAAEQLYRRVLEVREKILGPDHPQTLVSINSLSYLYRAQGKNELVEPLLKRALAGNEKALGLDHPDTITIVHNLASLCGAMKNYPAAEVYYHRALAGFEKAFGPDHPHTLHCVNGMGNLFEAKGDTAAAERYFKRAMTGREKTLGPDNPATLSTIHYLAALYFRTKRFAEAVPLCEIALRGYEKRPDGARDALVVRSRLGLALLGDQKAADAEPHLLAVYDGLTKEKALDSRDVWLRRVSQGLVDLYESTNQPAKVDEWRAKLAALPPAK